MLPFNPPLFLVLLLAAPALTMPSTSQELQVRGHRTARDAAQDSIKVVISEGCVSQGDSDISQGGKEIDLRPGSPLVLTHKIKLVPSGSGSGSGSCGCEADFAALRERLERLEREVSALREKCGGAEGGCCTSKESKGAGCSIKQEIDECPNDCSDQGRCVDGKCVCFTGFSGPDCSESNCPRNCDGNGRCVNGQCECDPGFTGPDCSQRSCPDDCNSQGRCVNGRCVCDSGFTGSSCSDKTCPGNCNSRGRCVNGQCACNPGFTGPDCSKRACPGNCNNRGRCVNGKCVCDSGFTGDDCSENSCPGNCNNRGRCVNGECVCDDGFGGPDCSERTCPNDCYDRGRCVNGKCVCDSGFTGDDCSENSCPGNCNNRGRCVNGQCVCNNGFSGADCSEKACPNNCSNRGKCVNGKCVCEVDFAGPDCAAKSCPNNCNNKGRCIKGRCVCRRGFTGPDCSQCDEGMTGPNCATVMSAVSQLSAQDVTETSVTLVWTPPAIQYETYSITFSSQKEKDQQVTVQVEGSLTSFTQTGLAAGQEYSVSIAGEIDGRRGAESSAEFTTLTSGPTNLRVVKTTTTSAVVQWEQSQGEIDRYRLTATPHDGAGRSQEISVPVGQNSAHIQQLEAGRLYDIILVAEKGASQSEAVTTQVTPGTTLPKVTTAALTMQVTLAPGQAVRDQEFDPSPEVQQEKTEDVSEAGSVKVSTSDGPNKDLSDSVIARTKPLVSKKTAIDGTKPKLAERPALSKRPKVPGPFHFNTTRFIPGARKVGPGTLKKPPVWEKKRKVPIVPKKPKPGVPTIGNRTIALTVRDPSMEASSTERKDAKNPAIMSGTDSDANRQSSSEEPTIAKEQPDVGMADHGNGMAPVSSGPAGTVQGQEKKCMNKIKVTHIRLPHKDRGSGCRGDGTVLDGNTAGSHQGSSETDDTRDLKPLSAEKDLDYSPDPLHTLLTNTFDRLNITTFVVHLSKPSNISVDSERVSEQILSGLKPLSSFSSSSSSSLQSSSQSSDVPSSLPSSSSSPSSPSTAAPSSSLTYLGLSIPSLSSSSPSSLPSVTPPPSVSLTSLSPSSSSSSFSRSDKSGPVGGNEPDVNNGKGMTDVASPEDRKPPSSEKGGVTFFRRTPVRSGYVRRSRPNFGSFQNKTRLNLRPPHRFPSHLNLIPGREMETRHPSITELLSTPSSSASEESSSVEANVPVRDSTGYKDGVTTPASSEVEQNEKNIPTERGQIPVRRLPPKGGNLRRLLPNFGPLQNRTRPNVRLLRQPSKPLNTASETRKDQVSPTELPATSSSPVSKESYPAGGEVNEDTVGTSMSTESNQTLRENGVPSSHRPATKVRWSLYGGHLPNKTLTNMRLPQHPQWGHIRKPFPNRRLNGGISVGSQEKVHTTDTPDSQSGEQDAPMLTQAVHIRQSGEEGNAEVIPSSQMDGTIVSPETNKLEGEDNAPAQPTKSGDQKIQTPSSNSDVHKDRVSAPKYTGATGQGIPTKKQTSSYPRHGATLLKRLQSNAEAIPGAQRNGTTFSPVSNKLKGGGNAPVQTSRSGEEEIQTSDSNFDLHKDRVSAPTNTGITNQGRPTKKQTSSNSRQGATSTVTLPKRLQGNAEVIPSAQMDGTNISPEPNKVEGGVNVPVQTSKSGEQEIQMPDSNSDLRKDRVSVQKNTVTTNQGRPIKKQTSPNSRQGVPRPVTLPKRLPPTSGGQVRHYTGNQKTNNTAKRLFNDKTAQTKSPKSDISSSGVTREPLDYVGVTNRTSEGFTLTWDSPEGKYKNFVVTRKEVGKAERPKHEELKKYREEEDSERHNEDEEAKHQPTIESESENRNTDDENRVPDSVFAQVPTIQSSTTANPAAESDKTFKKVLPGSARSFQFEDLPPKREYTVTLLGKGPGLLSRLHKLVISTGPEPPTDIVFSEVTDKSLTVSWTKPKSPVSGFKVTYTHTEDGEPVSVSVDSSDSTLGLSQLSPGSSYEVNVISILGLDESDPIRDFVMTLPDPPTDLRAVNVTDTKALLLWRPALATIDKYAIVYGSGTGSELRVTVSGNAAEQQLSGLEGSTTYTVTITSQLGSVESPAATTSFTTSRGSGGDQEGPHDLQASNVTPRTATLSWKPPSNPVGGYRLTIQTEGQEMKEVTVDGSVTEYDLSRLHPGSKYTVELQAEEGGRYSAAISTDFTTGTLRFPFPTDCSQELLNGIKTSGEVEVFPHGKLGTPIMVYCDMETDGGGWMVFQRRKDGSVNFFKGWKDYVKGFGDLSGEFWLGLDSLHNLTTMTRMTLRVDLRDHDESVFAKYSTFEVAKRNYRLTVGGYSGTAGDSLSYHNNRVFSTKDRDPAPFITRCAMSYRGGWWYKNCHEANLNGLYGIDVKHQGVIWTTWKGKDFSIPFTEMKMRPAAFSPPTTG